MRARSALVFVPAGIAALLVAASSPAARASRVGVPTALDAAHDTEVRRVRAHFDSVLRELGARDVAPWTVEQREQRAALVATLRAYRDRGEFPHNYDFPGELVPYFVDRETGTRCAVAQLLETTGRRDIVDRVARTNNNVRVAQLATDTAFTGWLDAHGLTLEEAARIQVPYAAPTLFGQHPGLALGASTMTAASVVMSVVNGTANADGRGPIASGLGMVFGVTAVALGAGAASVQNGSGALGAVSMVSGIVSLGISTRGIIRQRRAEAAERHALHEVREQREAMRATIVPLVGAAEGRPSAGVGVSVRF